jgi:hypothetical protein
MADPDVRWLQRLENYNRALEVLERALIHCRATQHQRA